jgi:transposase
MEAVRGGKQSLREAAERLRVSYRQVRRIWRRFEEKGEAGLVHRGRGRRSNRSKPEQTRRACLAIYRVDLEGFGPTLAAEKLAEQSLVVDHETLRRWLLAEGLWQKERRRGKYRRSRPRKQRFGELVQMDGSHHEWFGSGKRCCLMSMVDDATGRRHSLLAEEETTEAAMRLLWRWVELYGVPRALYTDRKNVYVTAREPTIEEELAGEPALTAFGKACRKLGIQIIPASSPQAKGRVERSHAVYQDRLVKEIRLRKLTELSAVNELLDGGGFDEGLNRRFATEPADPLDLHQAVAAGLDLGGVFAGEQTRVVNNDWTVRFENRWLQLRGPKRRLPPAKSKVLVQQRLDGSLHLLYRDQPLQFAELAHPPLPAHPAPQPQPTQPESKPRQPPRRPADDHPWRHSHIGRRPRSRRAADRAAAAESPKTASPQPLGKRSAFPTRPAAPTTNQGTVLTSPNRGQF